MRTVNFISSAIMCIIQVLFKTDDTDSVSSESGMEVTIVNIKYIVSIPEC